MKNALTYLLIISLLLSLTACNRQTISASAEYHFLDGAVLPFGYSVTESAEGGYLICSGGYTIGGICLLDLTELSESDLYHLSDHLIAAAEEIAQQIKPAEYDHISQTSEYAYKEIDFVSVDGPTYRHYIIETDSGYCDCWFDLSQITPEKALIFFVQLFG